MSDFLFDEIAKACNPTFANTARKTWEDALLKMIPYSTTLIHEGIEVTVDFEYNQNNGDGSVLSVYVGDVDIYGLLSEDTTADLLNKAIQGI